MEPVVIAVEGGVLVVGTHDTERAARLLSADQTTSDALPMRRAAGEAIAWRREWLERDDDYDYDDWMPVDAGTPGAIPALVLE